MIKLYVKSRSTFRCPLKINTETLVEFTSIASIVQLLYNHDAFALCDFHYIGCLRKFRNIFTIDTVKLFNTNHLNQILYVGNE